MTTEHDVIDYLEKQIQDKLIKVELYDEITVRYDKTHDTCYDKKLSLTLSPYELFCICDKLDISSLDFISKYANIVFDSNVNLPIITFGEQGCKFAIKGKCILGDNKPNACAIHPLLRIRQIDSSSSENAYLYYITEKKTNTIGELITLEKWLKKNFFDTRDVYSINYQKFNFDLLSIIDFNKLNNTKELTFDEKAYFSSIIINILYGSYTPHTDKKLEERYTTVINIITDVVKEYPFLKKE